MANPDEKQQATVEELLAKAIALHALLGKERLREDKITAKKNQHSIQKSADELHSAIRLLEYTISRSSTEVSASINDLRQEIREVAHTFIRRLIGLSLFLIITYTMLKMFA